MRYEPTKHRICGAQILCITKVRWIGAPPSRRHHMSGRSDVSPPHLVDYSLRLANRQSDDQKRGIACHRGRELTAVRDEEVYEIVRPAPLVHHAFRGIVAHPARA